MTSTRVILPTPCRNTNGDNRQRCTGQITWEDHGPIRLGACDLCGHEYAHELGVYERHRASEETADA